MVSIIQGVYPINVGPMNGKVFYPGILFSWIRSLNRLLLIPRRPFEVADGKI